jgi:uncharacterized protein with GYD domain
VNKEIADFGCKVAAQYAVLGQCDFVTVIEAPDNETVALLSNFPADPGVPMRITTLIAPAQRQHTSFSSLRGWVADP